MLLILHDQSECNVKNLAGLKYLTPDTEFVRVFLFVCLSVATQKLIAFDLEYES